MFLFYAQKVFDKLREEALKKIGREGIHGIVSGYLSFLVHVTLLQKVEFFRESQGSGGGGGTAFCCCRFA